MKLDGVYCSEMGNDPASAAVWCVRLKSVARIDNIIGSKYLVIRGNFVEFILFYFIENSCGSELRIPRFSVFPVAL